MEVQQEIKGPNEQFVQRQVLPMELTSGTSIPDLNDDCLRKIFSINSLTPMDLCFIAETCARFKQITQSVFPKAFTFITTYRKSECWFTIKSENYRKQKSMRDVERIFMNFGPCISEIEMISKLSSDLLNLVAKHCNGTLRRLNIDMAGSKIDELTLEPCYVALKSICRGLMLLDLREFQSLDEFEGVFANCDTLTKLIIGRECNANYILSNNFPQLQQLALFYDEHYFGRGALHSIAFCDYRNYCPSDTDIIHLTRQLIHLRKLNVSSYKGSTNRFVLSEKLFSEIVEIVKDRPHILILTCRFKFSLIKFDEYRNVRLINKMS